ncbi:putative ABC transporter substrate-binding lipoprotein [Oscillibacter valericigenes Sjm18-20]|nr:putative ABC transporter substrate-binding lipoprotein [Oscillibacter valericigenes Sjm18-20]
MKKHISRLFAALSAAALLSGCGSAATEPSASSASESKLQVVATVFPAYDFARAVCGDLAEVTMLLPPGAESHSYEPTPKDILAVEGSDLFLYLGGDSDAWVETLLESVDGGVNGMKMMDCVELKEEAETEGMTAGEEHDHGAGEVLEYDEHVWTSPVNAAAITTAIGERMGELDPDHAADYQANAADYAGKLMELDKEFRDFFATVSNKTMVFGDRFPLRYFADEYGLNCYAAFPGCSTQTEPSAATIAFLTRKVEQEKLGTVYYIEFSNHLVADSIAEATGAQTALFHSCHNVSQADMDAGATYLTLMEKNLETLKATMK